MKKPRFPEALCEDWSAFGRSFLHEPVTLSPDFLVVLADQVDRMTRGNDLLNPFAMRRDKIHLTLDEGDVPCRPALARETEVMV